MEAETFPPPDTTRAARYPAPVLLIVVNRKGDITGKSGRGNREVSIPVLIFRFPCAKRAPKLLRCKFPPDIPEFFGNLFDLCCVLENPVVIFYFF